MSKDNLRVFVVKVQHPIIELADGTLVPNFITVGKVVCEDDPELALLAAQQVFCDHHCPALLTVEPDRG